MAKFKPGGIRIGAELIQDINLPLVDGAVATDGVQYSSVATVGTTAVTVFNKLFDPGFTIGLQKLEVGLTQAFAGLNGSSVASANYYWTAASEYVNSQGTQITGAAVPITGTYARSAGTLLSSEDTFSGYVSVASIPFAPVRLKLIAVDANKAADFTAKVKSSSFIRMVGHIIPGT